MLVISSREFRENLKSYLDRADEGLEILIQRGKNKSYKLVPTKEDDTLMSKEEFFAKITRSLAQYERGEYDTMLPNEDLDTFLTRVQNERILG